MTHEATVQAFLLDMGLSISSHDPARQMFVVDSEREGVNQMILDIEDDILVIEQAIIPLKPEAASCHKRLLQMNRSLLHGAFCLNETGDILLYRDTLQLENLDRNELEASIRSLSMALAEFSAELLQFANV